MNETKSRPAKTHTEKKTATTAASRIADRCPACRRRTLHLKERYCLAHGCGFAEEIKERKH